MATINNNGGNHRHDGQKNYQGSNQRNPDNIRNETRKHEYKNHEDVHKNDELYDVDTQKAKVPMDFEDQKDNVSKNEDNQ